MKKVGKIVRRCAVQSCIRQCLPVLALLLGSHVAHADVVQSEPEPEASQSASPAYCSGEYADDFGALSAKAREAEQAHAAYTFCVRTTATYACPFYGPDAELQSTRKTAVAHGTGFAYQVQGNDTLLLTNQHVSDWPLVTDERHTVEDVPTGCKRISASLAIVDNEADTYDADDLPLSQIVSDPQLDVAVLRAHTILPVMPWSVGHSATLHTRNVVQVRGFPLGIFKATNVGKVISAYDHDTYGDWDHDDFVIDALLSSGNSGSPVLAISCKTGEFELVGIFHAGYSRGSALNVVIGIDQVHDLMTTFKRKPRPVADSLSDGDFDARAVEAEVRRQAIGGFLFPFGSRIGGVWVRPDDTLIFNVLGRNFPFETFPVFAAELPSGAAPQAPFARVWFGKATGLEPYPVSELDAETQAQLAKIGRALRFDSYLTARYRAADREVASREASAGVARIERSLENAVSSQKDLVRLLSDLADRLGPAAGKPALSLEDVLEAPTLPSSGVAVANAVAAVGPQTASGTPEVKSETASSAPASVPSIALGDPTRPGITATPIKP